MDIIHQKLESLSHSSFRNSFHLKEKEKKYIEEKGIDTIKVHAQDFIEKRLSNLLANDGKQTPMKGHPVFIAQHATGTCCRKCLYKWHHIPQDRPLLQTEKNYIVCIIMAWIQKERRKSIDSL